jgi:hypothetical protein
MDDIKIRVTKIELDFIREALFNYYEELNERFYEAENEQAESIPDFFKKFNESEFNEKPKKPHWTQTPEGKKIMANRKPRGKKK